jgi:putative DNA primase/helicase
MDDSNRLAKSIVSAATSGPVIGALRNATAQGGMAVRDDHHSGQVRMAYRLAKQCDGKLLHVHGIGWHYWDGTRWAFDDRGEAKRSVLAMLKSCWAQAFSMSDKLEQKRLISDVKKCESSAGIAGVLSIAAALTAFATTVRDIDADPYLLNVANGTLDLHSLELRPHSAADRITKRCRGAYDRNSEAKDWEAFLSRVLPDEHVRHFLQRVAGVGLIGAVREHVLPILTGKGANGKSAFDHAVRFTLGDYAITAEPDLFMHREGAHPTGEMDLRGVRWVSVSESDKDRRLAEATVKRLTGGDTVRARRMRQDFVEFEANHTAMLITNHLPKVSGDDPAIWRRLRVVPFDVVIPRAEQDGALGEKLAAEADGILTWIVAGLRDYLDIGGLAEPDRVMVATDAYHTASDSVSRFIADCCVTSSHGQPGLHGIRATTTELHRVWIRWQAQDGCEPMGTRTFGLALDNKGYVNGAPSQGKRFRKGIGLRAEWSDGS